MGKGVGSQEGVTSHESRVTSEGLGLELHCHPEQSEGSTPQVTEARLATRDSLVTRDS
jgi:hypothetical protein